jgi:hypothetical protein
MLRFGPGALQILFDPGYDFRALRGHILILAEVGAEVIEFERRARLRPHGFPIAHPHGLLKAALVKFPIEEVVAIGLGLAQHILEEGRKLLDAGCLEITLLGQTVNGYRNPIGACQGDPNGADFASLLRAIAAGVPVSGIGMTTLASAGCSCASSWPSTAASAASASARASPLSSSTQTTPARVMAMASPRAAGNGSWRKTEDMIAVAGGERVCSRRARRGPIRRKERKRHTSATKNPARPDSPSMSHVRPEASEGSGRPRTTAP